MIREGLGPIATLGPLIHNPQEVERLARLGIISRNTFAEIREKQVLIRTHGVAAGGLRRGEKARLRDLGLHVPVCAQGAENRP